MEIKKEDPSATGPKRLGILIPMKSWGGIEGKMVTLCREFLARGIEVELFMPRGGVIPYPERLPDAVCITDLGSAGKLDTARKLASHLRRGRVDVLLAAKDHGVKAAILARWLARSRVPIYIKLTNTVSVTLRRPGKRWLARWMYSRANGVIAVSEGVRQDFLRHFAMAPEQVVTIYNPAIPDNFEERAAMEVTHPWLRDSGAPVILGVGRLTDQKGFDVLIEAFSRLRQRRDARLIILGEGPARNRLEEQAAALGLAADVDLVGSVPDVLPWARRASLYVLSSRYEGLPNVLIEALAAGAPVVATDCPSGPREILEGGQLGPLVPVDDAEALAAAMEQALGCAPLSEERERSLVRFRSGPVAQRYLETMGLLDLPGSGCGTPSSTV